MDAAEPQNKTRGAGERTDNVISDAGSNVNVVGVRMLGKQQFGVGVGFLKVFQTVVMLFQEHAVRIGLHPGGESHGVESLGVAFVLLQAHGSQRTRLRGCRLESFNAIRIRSASYAPEETLVIQEIIAGEHALQVKLLE